MASQTAQERFDEAYITSTEISIDMNVSRPTVLRAKQRGFLPDPISVGEKHVVIWERRKIRPILDLWKKQLAERRGETSE